MIGFEEYSVAWFEKWFDKYCFVFGLRNGLRKCFMKLDTKWYEKYSVVFGLRILY